MGGLLGYPAQDQRGLAKPVRPGAGRWGSSHILPQLWCLSDQATEVGVSRWNLEVCGPESSSLGGLCGQGRGAAFVALPGAPSGDPVSQYLRFPDNDPPRGSRGSLLKI